MERFEFEIPDSNFYRFKALMQKISKKSQKLGFPEIPYMVVGYHLEKQRGKVWEIYMTSPSFKVEGWKFVAIIDHTHETGNIIRAIPGEAVPDKFRDVKPYCEHCGINRYRRDTYVLRADDGGYKQVGKTCLVDFLGHDPGKIAQLAEAIGNAYNDIIGFGYVGHSSPALVDLKEFLNLCAQSIREDGWVSGKFAYENNAVSTARKAEHLYISRENVNVTDEDKALATNALVWAQSLAEKENKNDYEHNVSIISDAEFIEFRSIGLAASIVGVHYLNVQRSLKPKSETPKVKSQHVGAIGEKLLRLPVILTVTRQLQNSILCKFTDEQGNILTWFSTNGLWVEKNGQEINPNIGDKLFLTARVKDHNEFNGEKSTIINRGKLSYE